MSSPDQTPRPETLSAPLRRNIAALEAWRRQQEAGVGRRERLACAITRFTGSMACAYLHAALYGAWILLDLGAVPGLGGFDPHLAHLGTLASVEAIFLSTFVLVGQNRMAAAAHKRADLDLQISLLTERELTKLAELIAAIAERTGVSTEAHPELEEIRRDVVPEAVLDEIEAHRR